MAKPHGRHSDGDDKGPHKDDDDDGPRKGHGDGGDGGGDGGEEREGARAIKAHIEIEERRFRGGLQPTPELYAQALVQWSQLPGAVMRTATDPPSPAPSVDPGSGPGSGPDDASADDKGGAP
jgi:hypothetical protein